MCWKVKWDSLKEIYCTFRSVGLRFLLYKERRSLNKYFYLYFFAYPRWRRRCACSMRVKGQKHFKIIILIKHHSLFITTLLSNYQQTFFFNLWTSYPIIGTPVKDGSISVIQWDVILGMSIWNNVSYHWTVEWHLEFMLGPFTHNNFLSHIKYVLHWKNKTLFF